MIKERIIYNNYNLHEMFDDCRAYLAENYDPAEITDEMIWNQIYIENELNWDDERERLKEFFDGADRYLIRGYVGRWNGSHAAGHMFDDFDKMFYQAAQDCDYWKIWDENGHLYLKCTHHDGTNLFEIKHLTQKAVDFLEKWENDFGDIRTMEEIHDIIWTSNFFSGLPHYAHRVYGCQKREAATA